MEFIILKKTFLIICISYLWAIPAYGLVAEDLLIIYNTNIPDSKDVATYYAKKRNVPKKNIVGLELSSSETIQRTEYNKNILPKVRAALLNKISIDKRKPTLLLSYGVPLRIVEEYLRPGNSEFNNLTKEKITEYTKIILRLLQKANQLSGYQEKFKINLKNKPPTRVYNITSFAIRSLEFSKANQKNRTSNYSEEISRIYFLLFGIQPFAKQARSELPDDINMNEYLPLLSNSNILKLTTLLNVELNSQVFFGVTKQNASEKALTVRAVKGLLGEISFWSTIENSTLKNHSSVDSELSLALLDEYKLKGWLPNPFLDEYNNIPLIERIRNKVVMTARIDAPTAKLAKRMIDDGLEAEKTGLKGTFYIDARGLDYKKKKDAYSCFDEHLRNLYRKVKKAKGLTAILDNRPELIKRNGTKKLDTALYVGWYALKSYDDSFNWEKGSVGYHIASGELGSLRNNKSNAWVKRMIEEGIAASLGPVYEPYLAAFPPPDRFFPLLLKGKLTLLEVYFKSLPYISWQQAIVGDPLYRPFKNFPIDIEPETKQICN